MRARWFLDREDPRTVLLVTVGILVFGVVIVDLMLDGGMPVIFVLAWFVVSVAQVVWAAHRYRQWRRRDS